MAVLPQARTEALLAEALAVFGVVPERGTALGSFEQDNEGVDAVLISFGRSENVRAPIMLAADGAHSKVRETLGIKLEGSTFPEDWPLCDIELDDPLDTESAHVCFVEGGMVFLHISDCTSMVCADTAVCVAVNTKIARSAMFRLIDQPPA
jgi:2-polyprenyl-6-methoxyphenol hydroxylase-like FAD-dependent oxidoreductase